MLCKDKKYRLITIYLVPYSAQFWILGLDCPFKDRIKLVAFGPEHLWKVRQQAWSFVTIPVVTKLPVVWVKAKWQRQKSEHADISVAEHERWTRVRKSYGLRWVTGYRGSAPPKFKIELNMGQDRLLSGGIFLSLHNLRYCVICDANFWRLQYLWQVAAYLILAVV